jgi:hypothetical protein
MTEKSLLSNALLLATALAYGNCTAGKYTAKLSQRGVKSIVMSSPVCFKCCLVALATQATSWHKNFIGGKLSLIRKGNEVFRN